jgi:hypothetical protein
MAEMDVEMGGARVPQADHSAWNGGDIWRAHVLTNATTRANRHFRTQTQEEQTTAAHNNMHKCNVPPLQGRGRTATHASANADLQLVVRMRPQLTQVKKNNPPIVVARLGNYPQLMQRMRWPK